MIKRKKQIAFFDGIDLGRIQDSVNYFLGECAKENEIVTDIKLNSFAHDYKDEEGKTPIETYIVMVVVETSHNGD